MARSRIVKPEFWDDEKLAVNTSRDARLTFIGMWNHSDDYAVVKGHPLWLKNKIFPYDEIKPPDFLKWLKELEAMHCIIPFEADGEKYYYIRTFPKHQTINRPSLQRNPEPPSHILDGSLIPHGVLTDETETEVKPKQKPKPSKEILLEAFQKFWTEYPRKVAKGDAENAWAKINPSEHLTGEILSAVQRAKTSTDWLKDSGQYIPYPATWLNRKGWEDQLATEPNSGQPLISKSSAGILDWGKRRQEEAEREENGLT
jgi:hypothetical protein